MAEALVPKILDRLSDVVMTQLEEKVKLVMGVEEEVGNLSNKLGTIEKVLHDAERRRVKEGTVWLWLEKLEDITYEMEDVLDEWNLKINVKSSSKDILHDDRGADRRRMPTATVLLLIKKVRSLCSCLKQVPVRNEIALKIKEINGKLESTLKEANQFNFVTTSTDHHSSSTGPYVDSREIFKRPMTTSVFDESEVRGREFDKDSLLQHLLADHSRRTSSSSSASKEMVEEDGVDHVKVISIVGVGGSGKTTLAQFLYNDNRVNEYFEHRKWVCVSDPFNEKRIAKALIERPEMSNINNVSELESESLFHLVKKSFSGKRFLLVLDDVWTENSSEWKPFRDSLKDGAPGSIILVTTRSERVARALGTDHQHSVGLLSNSDCWSIIRQIALSGRSSDELCESSVENIGQRIAKKCKGLPLAAKTLGSLLQFKDTAREWQKVLDSEIWEMKEAAVDLFPHFYLSYKELSPELKRCFSYCAVFPKDTVINVETLIRLWMAHGYLGHPNRRRRGGHGDDEMEKKGYENFKILAMRCFFQDFEKWGVDESLISSCKMHDIVHDFAQFLVKSECSVFEKIDLENDHAEAKGGFLSRDRLRHATILGRTGSSTMKFSSSSVLILENNIGNLRSLFLSGNYLDGFMFLPDLGGSVFPLQDLCSRLKSVRSLKLSGCGLGAIPGEIGNLIHLRFLDLSSNRFSELPETICDLHYLESLDVSSCYLLQHLPERIGDLTVHLRHLLNSGTTKLKEMPRGIEELTSLRTLTKFVAARAADDHGGRQSSYQYNFGKLKYLERLEITYVLDDSKKMKVIPPIIIQELPPNLQFLVFVDYPATQLPNCIIGTKSLLNTLTYLTIYDAPLISSLPALGKLSSLQRLLFRKLPNLKHIGREFYGLPAAHDHHKDDANGLLQVQGHHKDEDGDGDGDGVQVVAFPSLKQLIFDDLENWETWEDISTSEEGDDDHEKMKKKKNATVSISGMPRLEFLNIEGCNKLEALPHRILGKASSPSLKQLSIYRCDKLRKRYSDKTGDDWKRISHIPDITI